MKSRDNQDIIIKKQIQSLHSEQLIVPMLEKFFEGLGFNEIIVKPSSISIKRGSKFRNAFTNDPLKWNSNIELLFTSHEDFTNVEILII